MRPFKRKSLWGQLLRDSLTWNASPGGACSVLNSCHKGTSSASLTRSPIGQEFRTVVSGRLSYDSKLVPGETRWTKLDITHLGEQIRSRNEMLNTIKRLVLWTQWTIHPILNRMSFELWPLDHTPECLTRNRIEIGLFQKQFKVRRWSYTGNWQTISQESKMRRGEQVSN